ncbi:MAG TPA: hypothetical protein VHW00_24095 [Thermoanaerobaculia bacterium]|nr:hypothetical protein [Thermoanaerobaculia bacterium]
MRILFEDGVCEDVETEPDGDFHRLAATPLSSSTDARFGDVIELAAEGPIWRFVRVAEASPFVTLEFLLSREVAESEAFGRVLDHVRDQGGIWERAFGGMVFVHVPPETANDVKSRLAELG